MPIINPTLSVVVIGRNEGERLRRCLESVESMNPVAGGFELIYVDSGSADKSVEIAASHGARVIQLPSQRPSAAMARNAGWRSARAEWVLFLDGDTVLHPGFPCSALNYSDLKPVGVIWGHRREIRPTANLFHRVLDLDWVYTPGLTPFCGGDALMRRSCLEQTDGFDETLIAGEEPELCARLRACGFSILHIDAPMTRHDLSISRWSQYWRRATRAGYAYAQIAARTSRTAMPLWRSEARGNAVRTTVLIALAAYALLQPLFVLGVYMGLIARSAWRARWKSTDVLSLLCYGAHSHLQQIPVFAGQLTYWLDAVRERRRGLIEYK